MVWTLRVLRDDDGDYEMTENLNVNVTEQKLCGSFSQKTPSQSIPQHMLATIRDPRM